jgi:hypothetical protein
MLLTHLIMLFVGALIGCMSRQAWIEHKAKRKP